MLKKYKSVIFPEVDYSTIAKQSWLFQKEINLAAKIIESQHIDIISDINILLSAEINNILNKYDLEKDNISDKDDIILSGAKSITDLINSKKSYIYKQVQQVLDLSKKAWFNWIEIISKEHILREKILNEQSKSIIDYETLAIKYKHFFDNYIGFIEEEPKEEKIINNGLSQQPNPDEILISPSHDLGTNISEEQILETKKNEEKSKWEKIAGLF